MAIVTRAAMAVFSGFLLTATVAVAGSSAAAAEPAASVAAGPAAQQSAEYEQRDITQPPWRVHSTHRTLDRCKSAGKRLMSTGAARETSCVPFYGTWRLMYR